MFMLSARQENTFKSWSSFNSSIELVDTRNISMSYKNHRCRSFEWRHRLFYVYQQVFLYALRKYPRESGFIFVEDDGLLLNRTLLECEMCSIGTKDFYSFYQTSESAPSCIYEFSTLAFFMSAAKMQDLINADSNAFCRLPIDMFIARDGPWYVSTRRIVRHLGTGKRLYNIVSETHQEHRSRQRLGNVTGGD